MHRIWGWLVVVVAFGGQLAAAQNGPCQDLLTADSALKVRIVEANTPCSVPFVAQMENNPANYLTAFYSLIDSPKATDALFIAVYEELRLGRFRFAPAILEELSVELPRAAAACTGSSRCSDWTAYVVSAFNNGEGAGPATINPCQDSNSFSSSCFRCSAENLTLSSLRPLKVRSAARLTGGYFNCSRNSSSCS